MIRFAQVAPAPQPWTVFVLGPVDDGEVPHGVRLDLPRPSTDELPGLRPSLLHDQRLHRVPGFVALARWVRVPTVRQQRVLAASQPPDLGAPPVRSADLGDRRHGASQHLPKVHLLISNLETWLRGTFHGVSDKHLPTYAREFVYRFNRRHLRDGQKLFNYVVRRVMGTRPTTRRQLVHGDQEPLAVLTPPPHQWRPEPTGSSRRRIPFHRAPLAGLHLRTGMTTRRPRNPLNRRGF